LTLETVTEKRYAIKAGYRCNPPLPDEQGRDSSYWDSGRRIAHSRRYQWHVYKWAQDLVRAASVGRVLDIGCGPAAKLNRLIVPHVEQVIGVDQAQAVDYCRRAYASGSYAIDDLEAPAQELEWVPQLVICADVVEHLRDPDPLLQYLRSAGDADTSYLFSTPDRDRLRGTNAMGSPNPSHIREWAAHEFARYLQESGYEVLEERFYPPVKPGFNRLTAAHLLRMLREGHRWRYNFAVLCRSCAE